IPWFPVPFGQQIVGKVARIGVVLGFEFICLFEEAARFSNRPILIYRNHLHGDVPLRTFGGKRRSRFEDSPGFGCAFRKKLPPAMAGCVGVTAASRIMCITQVSQSQCDARSDGFRARRYPSPEPLKMMGPVLLGGMHLS